MAFGGLLNVLERLRPWRLTEQQIRAEAWALGARHKGQIRAGALEESRDQGISLRRAILLNAVLRAQRAKDQASPDEATPGTEAPRVSKCEP